MKLSELVKNYRMEHGLSQREFAARAHLTGGYIWMLETKNPKTKRPIKPSLDSLDGLAKAMNMTLDELIRSVDDMPVSLVPEKYEETLSEDERAILELYRQASPEDRDIAFRVLSRSK